MINEKNIDNTISSVKKVAESIIENMPVGSRFTTKEFVDLVVEETHVPVAVAAGITALVVNNCDSVKPRAGRGGGIFKKATETVNNRDLSAVASVLMSKMSEPSPEEDDDLDMGEAV